MTAILEVILLAQSTFTAVIISFIAYNFYHHPQERHMVLGCVSYALLSIVPSIRIINGTVPVDNPWNFVLLLAYILGDYSLWKTAFFLSKRRNGKL